MKKAIIIVLAMFVISAPAAAQQLSLWADEGQSQRPWAPTTRSTYMYSSIPVLKAPSP